MTPDLSWEDIRTLEARVRALEVEKAQAFSDGYARFAQELEDARTERDDLSPRVRRLEALCADAIAVIEYLAPCADKKIDRAYGFRRAQETRDLLNETMGRTP